MGDAQLTELRSNVRVIDVATAKTEADIVELARLQLEGILQ